MNFLTMEYFLSIAEHRNITKAAAELHITQQTLSAHLTALEKELDTKLFIDLIAGNLLISPRKCL